MSINKTDFLGTKESLEQNKTSSSAISILNDIMEKNFPVTQIITNDYYTFENNLKENIGQINRSLVNIEHVFLVDAGGARMFDREVMKSSTGERTEVYNFLEINKENRPNIIDGQLERLIGSPLFGIMLLKKLVETLKEDQNKKNKMVIIKDFDLLFKTRKEQLLAYHKLESYYDFLATKECKLVILNKTKIESLNQQEIEIDIIKYTHSNRAFKQELMNDTKAMTAQMSESTGVDILSDLDIETFLDLTEHLTFCELENIIKDGFESTEDLMERFETRKLKKIMEANPEIKITKPTVTLEQLIGFKNAKSFVLKGMDKKMIKSMLILGVPGTGEKNK